VQHILYRLFTITLFAAALLLVGAVDGRASQVGASTYPALFGTHET